MDTTHASAVYLKLIRERRDKLQKAVKRYSNKIDEANLELEELTKILEPPEAKPQTKR